MMTRSIFDGILNKLDMAGPTSTIGGGMSRSSSPMGQDGMEAIAMLTILTSFNEAYNAAMVHRLTGELEQQTVHVPQATISNSGTPAHKAVVKFNIKEDLVTVDDAVEEKARSLCSELYINSVLEAFKKTLLSRVEEFTVEQIQWIRTVKADPKAPEVLLPVAAFHSFIAQVNEMCCGQVLCEYRGNSSFGY